MQNLLLHGIDICNRRAKAHKQKNVIRIGAQIFVIDVRKRIP